MDAHHVDQRCTTEPIINQSMSRVFVADYSPVDAKYAATTIVSTSLPPTRDVRALVALRKPYVSRNELYAVRLLDPIAAFAINLNVHADAADTSNNEGTGVERCVARLHAMMASFRFASAPQSNLNSSLLGDIEEEIRVELAELRAQVAAADRKAQLAAWFASAPMDVIGKYGFKYSAPQRSLDLSHWIFVFVVLHRQLLPPVWMRFCSSLRRCLNSPTETIFCTLPMFVVVLAAFPST